jgi:rubrerythrin
VGRPVTKDVQNTLFTLAKTLMELQEKCRALGSFTNHRELAECQTCGLLEDVDISGRLLVCSEDNLSELVGTFFIESDNDVRCPKCKRVVLYLAEEDNA